MAHLCAGSDVFTEFRYQKNQEQILFPKSGCKLYVADWTISLPGLPQLVARQPLSSDKPLFDILEITVYFISFLIITGVQPVQPQGLRILQKADLVPPIFFIFK